jgi:hypothetical protein
METPGSIDQIDKAPVIYKYIVALSMQLTYFRLWYVMAYLAGMSRV